MAGEASQCHISQVFSVFPYYFKSTS